MTSKCKATTKKTALRNSVQTSHESQGTLDLRQDLDWNLITSEWVNLWTISRLVGHIHTYIYIRQWKGDDGEPEGYGMKMKTQGKLNDAEKKIIVCATFCSVLIYNQQKKIGTKSRKPEMNRNECTTVSKTKKDVCACAASSSFMHKWWHCDEVPLQIWCDREELLSRLIEWCWDIFNTSYMY